jgi:ATP adenylyltransferase
MAYVTGEGKPGKTCVFCDAADTRGGHEAAFVVARGALAYVILNRFPYNNGHLLVAPHRHVASLAALDPEDLADMMRLTRQAEVALSEAYRPHGINIGMNLGQAAGAGIADHLHIHVVPRWNGDTNFMSVVGEVRVLPEELDETARRLRPIFDRLS